MQCKRAILTGECVRGSSSYSFSTNKNNYARYGNWYVYQLRNRDSLHSGNDIISVQSQARCNLRTAVDQRGEQSLNKNVKTVGGDRRFSADNDVVFKCTMGRADQAQNLNSLLQRHTAFTDCAFRITHIKP